MADCQALIKRRNQISTGLGSINAKIEQIDKETSEILKSIVDAGYDPGNLENEVQSLKDTYAERRKALEAELDELEEFVNSGLEALK